MIKPWWSLGGVSKFVPASRHLKSNRVGGGQVLGWRRLLRFGPFSLVVMRYGPGEGYSEASTCPSPGSCWARENVPPRVDSPPPPPPPSPPDRWRPDWCGSQIKYEQGDNSHVWLTCVSQAHPDSEPHRSGTSPKIKWRADPENPQVIKVWTDWENDPFQGGDRP